MADVKLPTWRPGWTEAGTIVRHAGHRWLCLARTAGRPSERATNYWKRLD